MRFFLALKAVKEALNKSFDRTNGKLLIPFVVMLSLSKHRTMSGINLFSVQRSMC